MFKKRGQGQSWSLDIVLAFVVFVLIIAIFYSLLNQNKKSPTEELNRDATTIASNLDAATGLNTQYSIIDKGKIDDTKLQALYERDYDSLKTELGIRGDFCIYLVDQYNNIITVNTATGEKIAFGNGNYTINDLPCGSKVT